MIRCEGTVGLKEAVEVLGNTFTIHCTMTMAGNNWLTTRGVFKSVNPRSVVRY